jgi:hypothetical protein
MEESVSTVCGRLAIVRSHISTEKENGWLN